jgi:DNA-binding GntR family transcriptional regulator
MSPAGDDVVHDIRGAVERLKAAGTPCTEDNIAAELGMSATRLHALMRQLFSEGRRIEPEEPSR